MRNRCAAVVVAVLVLVSTGVGTCNCLLQFEAFAGADNTSAQVVARGKVILRLRGGNAEGLLTRAQAIAQKMNTAAMSGARPTDVTVKAADQQAQLIVAGQAVVTVNAALAKSANSSAEGLAQSWAANVKAVLADPYLTITPYPEVLVPVGESRTIRWGGTAGRPDSISVADESVVTMQDSQDGKGVVVWALQPGDTQVTVGLRECSSVISVLCRKWAARIPPTSQLQVSGARLRKEQLPQAVECLVRSVTNLEPGAWLAIGTPVTSADGYQVNVKAEGGAYLPVVRTHMVQIQRIAAPEMTADTLLVSNVPEKVAGPAVLLREHLGHRQGARLLWHHVNASSSPMHLSVRVHNLGDRAIPLHLTEGRAGPSLDELFAGHVAASRFMSDLFSGIGYVLPIPAGSSIEISEVRLRPRELASGVKRMVPLGDGELIVEVTAEETTGTSRRSVTAAPGSMYADRPTSGFAYDGEKLVDMLHTVGDGWCFYSLGKDTDMSTAGNPLMGSYGVLHRINATVENPTDRSAAIELVMHPRGGIARGVFWIEGRLVETPMLDNQSEKVIHRATVLAGNRYSVRVFTIPQSGSHYPVLLTLRSRPQ